MQFLSLGSFDFFENTVFRSIYSFHMPLFMLVSGYLFFFSVKKRTLIEVLKKKVIKISIPIIVWNFIIYIVTNSINLLKGEFTFSVVTLIKSVKGLWFLWAVLACSLIVGVIYKLIKNECIMIFSLVLAAPLTLFFPNSTMILFLYPYFVIGFLFNQYNERIPKLILKLRYATLLIFPLLLSFFHKQHYIYTTGINPFSSEYGVYGQIEINIFRWGIGLIGSIAIITLLNLFYIKFSESKIIKRFEVFGETSLQIYVMQTLVLEPVISTAYSIFVNKLGYNFLTQNVILCNYIITPILAVILTLILSKIALFINKSKSLSFCLFGR